MRLALLIGLAFTLGSCSKAVTLMIDNQSEVGATIASNGTEYSVDAGKAQKVAWPDPQHTIMISVDHCSRTFDLDEFYTPWNDWRYKDGELARLFAIDMHGGLKIVRPDAAHVA